MKKILYANLLVFICFSLPFKSKSQLQISSTSNPYTIDFSGFSGLGFKPVPDSGELSSNIWSITGMSDGTLFFDSIQNTPSTDFARGFSAGNVTTGGIYAFNTGSGNVILGAQPIAADFTPGDLRLRIKNAAGTDFTKLFISYDIFYLNNEERANSLNFSHSSDNSTYTSIPSLDFVTPDTSDSNAQWVSISRAEFITGLTIANDSVYYLRWRGADDSGSGSRDEYGIDNITIIANPPNVVANFSALAACESDSVFFTDLSASGNGNIISWVWNFGDGAGTSTQQNPSYLYSSAGTFNVQLIIATDSLETDTVTKAITVYPMPQAAFTASDACLNNAVQFTDNTTISSGYVAVRMWDFSDGNTDTVPTPSHLYSNAGNYNVTLTVISDQGCADSVTDAVNIFELPLIDTSLTVISNPSCGASDGSITGISVSGTSPFTYVWMPGMETTIDLTNVSGGNYTFSVTDSNNCSSSAGFTLVSSGAPPAPAATSPASYCDGDIIDSLIATGTGGALNWYDDSLLTSLVGTGSPFMPPLNLGDNYFYVTETTTCEGPATAVLVTVNPSPNANAGTDASICDGNCVQLNAAGGGNYQWFPTSCLNDSAISNPMACCFGPDTIIYSVIVTNNFGCSDTDNVQVIIHENPVAGFSYNGMGFDSSNVQFTDTSINAVSWQWDFGDGSGSIQQNPMHNYVCFFQGTVSLTVTSVNGCTDTASQSILAICGSVKENSLSQSISVFPNPSNGKFMIRLTHILNSAVSIKISNILGETIYQAKNVKAISEFDLSAQPEGTYFVNITSGETSFTKKIVLLK